MLLNRRGIVAHSTDIWSAVSRSSDCPCEFVTEHTPDVKSTHCISFRNPKRNFQLHPNLLRLLRHDRS